MENIATDQEIDKIQQAARVAAKVVSEAASEAKNVITQAAASALSTLTTANAVQSLDIVYIKENIRAIQIKLDERDTKFEQRIVLLERANYERNGSGMGLKNAWGIIVGAVAVIISAMSFVTNYLTRLK